MPSSFGQRSAFDEVIDDSEPERAEIRRRRRKAKPKSLFTDSSEEDLRPPFKTQNPQRDIDIIEITDSDSEADKWPSRRLANLNHNATLSSFSSDALPSSSRILTDSTLSNHVNDSLKRFAFVGPASTINLTLRRASTFPVLPSRNAGVISSHIQSSPFCLAKLDLAKLSRCISCELKWTARKTASQKEIHIRSCAKKRAFNEETIWTLVQTEISKESSQFKGSRGHKTKEGASRTNTLLEDVVVDAAPKKRGKRKQVVTVLTTVPATRDMILARAQTILSVPPFSEPHQQEAAPISDGVEDEMPPPTLPFAPSGLAQLQGTTTRTLFTDSDSSWPPADNLVSHSFGDACNVDENIQLHVHSDSRTQIADEKSIQDARSEENDAAEVVLQASTGSLDNTSSPNINSLKKDQRKGKTRLPSHNLSVVSTTDNVEAMPIAKKGKEGTPSRTSKKSPKRASKFGEDWENHMKRHIVENVDLHHRVLRYEVGSTCNDFLAPVHFDVFMDLATLYAPPSNRLKLHLRNFLDHHAVHFYEGQTWKR